MILSTNHRIRLLLTALAVSLQPLWCQGAHSGVLNDDRADVLYHRYQGGGVTVDGPSVLVRKKFGENFAATANLYIDMVSSASIDVLSTASPYKEKRTQKSAGLEHLRGKTTYTLNYINSEESDYAADTVSASIAEDMFGDLTTVTLGFSRGWDEITRNVNKHRDPTFAPRDTDHRNYRLGVSQILTKNFIVNLNYENADDEGYLKSPYRTVRYCFNIDCTETRSQEEVYPRTRTSNAVGVYARYYLPYRAALNGGYRYYTDSWGIRSHTGELGYVHPFKQSWTFEGSVRFYTQNHADFYSDLFPYVDAQNFLGRDKELSTFKSQTFHLGAAYELPANPIRWIQRASVNLFFDRIEFQYDDFRNVLDQSVLPYEQPLYSFGANVYQLFFSAWF